MTEYKFRIGQKVDYFASRRFDRMAAGSYTVSRLLPLDGNTPQYRITNSVDGRERMVHEGEIGSRT